MRKMRKKTISALGIILLALGTLSLVYVPQLTGAASLDPRTECSGVIDKKPGEAFIVKITFRNTGTTAGVWKIAVTFESESWNWKSEQKRITLKPDGKEAVTWEGEVPEDAVIDSVARLVVYYDDVFVALNWWIHIIPDAELSIVASKVS